MAYSTNIKLLNAPLEQIGYLIDVTHKLRGYRHSASASFRNRKKCGVRYFGSPYNSKCGISGGISGLIKDLSWPLKGLMLFDTG
jgi:hypothetical protein